MCSAWFNADEVFVGKVTAVQGSRFEVEVSRVLKGAPAATKVVTTESSRGRWNAAVGETRVVFARGGIVGSWSDPVRAGDLHAGRQPVLDILSGTLRPA